VREPLPIVRPWVPSPAYTHTILFYDLKIREAMIVHHLQFSIKDVDPAIDIS
jgi:hypothetical protein